MALTKQDGTEIAKSPGGTVLQSVSDPDPQIKVLIDVYKETPYDGVDYPTQMLQLRFHTGQIIRQSTWDAEFTAPTISGISPATGGAAGGTVVTITGTGFTPDTTVTIGGNAATAIDVDNPTRLKCTTAAHTAGAVNVVVSNGSGTATLTNGYTFT